MEEDLKLSVSKLNAESKNRLLALWIQKERREDMQSIDVLFLMDDLHSEIYSENRGLGFSAAALIATNKILDIVYMP